MKHWLIKSEPDVFSIDDLAKVKREPWTGVRNYQARNSMRDDMKPGDLPFDLLKHVRQFVAGYEAEQCPLWLWGEAILQGYAAFRFLREHRRGRLHIDVANRRIHFDGFPALRDLLLIHQNAAREDQRLRSLARWHQPALHQ